VDDERCHELVVEEDLLLESVEHELGEVVDVGSLQDVVRSIWLELSFLEVSARTNKVRRDSYTARTDVKSDGAVVDCVPR